MAVLREDEISPPQSGALCVVGRLGGEGEIKRAGNNGKRKAISLLPSSTVCLLFFYSIFNGIPSESPRLSCGAVEIFPG